MTIKLFQSVAVVTHAALLFTLSACGDRAALDPNVQMGQDPQLPNAQNFLVPPMQVPKGAGWQGDAHPVVAAGLRIEKIASGLMHPRQLLTLAKIGRAHV